MVKVYSDSDFNAVYEQKRKIWAVFMGVSVAYLAICIACLVWHISLPYADPMLIVPKGIMYLFTVVYVAFAFPYLGIKYSRVRKYYTMLYYVSEGIKNDERNYFVGFEPCDLQKDYVDVVSCIFMTWNKKKQEWMRREAYMDAEKPLPEFSRGDLVRYVTQSNFIIQYEILAKEVLEIEEIDEYYGDYEYEDEEEDASDSIAEEGETEDEKVTANGDLEE